MRPCSNSLSVVTSTPTRQRSVPPPFFSDGSSINSDSTLDASNISVIDTENGIPTSVRKVRRNAKDILSFEPERKLSFYYYVASDGDIKLIAHKWITSYNIKPRESTFFMIQFFIDVAGFQNLFSLEMYNRLTPEEVLKELMDNCPEILSEYTYLLTTNSKWSQNVINNISEFIMEIVDCSHSEKTVFTRPIFNDLLSFLKLMAECKLYAIKHTGVFIALKFCVAFARTLNHYKNELTILDQEAYATQQAKSRSLAKCQTKYDLFVKLTFYSLRIVQSQCANIEQETAVMLASCAMDFSELFFLLPDHKSKTFTLNFLINTSVYSDVYLRYSCIKALKGILRRPNMYEDAVNIPRIFAALMNRVLDESLDVACEAIQSMTVALQHYSTMISKVNMEILIKCLYNRYYVIGAAAGQFFYTLRKRTVNSTGDLLRELARLNLVQMFQGMVPLCVESLLDAVDEFYQPELLIKYVLNCDIPFAEEIILVEVLAHSVSQIFKGRSSVQRIGCRNGKVDGTVNEKLLDQIVPKLDLLFEKFMNEEQCIGALLFMMNSFTYDDDSLIQHRSEMKNIFKLFIEIFHKSKSDSAMLMISEILWKCVQDTNPLKLHAESILRILIEDSILVYNRYVKNNIWEEDSFRLLEINLMKLNVIMRYHDISINWNFDFVQKLVLDHTNDYENLLCCAERCSNSYVLMNVRIFVKEGDAGVRPSDQMENPQTLGIMIDKHLSMCSEYLISDSTQLRDEGFKLMCKLCTDLLAFRSNDSVKTIIPRLNENQKQALVGFLRTTVFKRSANPKTSRWILDLVTDTICAGGFSPIILTYIFVYYHKFCNVYGDYYNALMKELVKHSRIITATIISRTLTEEHSNLLVGNAVSCGTIADLMKLSGQLFKITPKGLCYMVIKQSIIYCVKAPSCIQFLPCIQCFCSNLSNDEKLMIVEFMKTSFGNQFTSNELIQKFVKNLK